MPPKFIVFFFFFAFYRWWWWSFSLDRSSYSERDTNNTNAFV